MKKTYISPETIVVRLMPTTIIAESLTVNSETVNSNEVLTKEDVSTGGSTNVWDEEW